MNVAKEREAALLALAKAGDMHAFEEVVVTYLPMLFAYSRAICGDFHEAQDVVQETLLTAFKNLERFFSDAHFPTWLKAIARNKALQARAKHGRVRLAAEEILEAACDEFPSEKAGASREALQECLEKLGPRSRQLIELRYCSGATIEDMAATTQTNLQSLRWQMYRIRQSLHQCVQDRLWQN